MKKYWQILLVVIVTCAMSCQRQESHTEIVEGWKSVPHVPNVENERERRELDLREFIFLQNIVDPIRDEVVFLSFGYAKDSNWIEPPPKYIERFGKLRVSVRSVADANLFLDGLTSKSDKRVGHIYYVQVIEWLDENSAKVDYGLYGGPLYGGGVHGAVYEFSEGQWKLKTDGQHAIS